MDESQIDTSRYSVLDVWVSKRFEVGAEARIELMAQVFNLLNTETSRTSSPAGA